MLASACSLLRFAQRIIVHHGVHSFRTMHFVVEKVARIAHKLQTEEGDTTFRMQASRTLALASTLRYYGLCAHMFVNG